MRQMSFLPHLKEYLRRDGRVYTVRKYKMTGGEVLVDDVGVCWRTFLGEVYSKQELEPYVNHSGFDSLESWWRQVKVFIPTAGPYYLYEVRKGGESNA